MKEPDTVRMCDLRLEVRGLIWSNWGYRCGVREIWLGHPGSPPLRRAGKVGVCMILGVPGLREPIRRRLWQRINQTLKEIAFGSTSCVLHHPADRTRVFKASLMSCLLSQRAQREWLRVEETKYQALHSHLGSYLLPTGFEVRNLGARQPMWMAGTVQRLVVGEPIGPARLGESTWLPTESHLRGQWREICAAALRSERATGWMLDAGGAANILIEQPAGAPSRLVIVDTGPLARVGPMSRPIDAVNLERTRQLLEEGARL